MQAISIDIIDFYLKNFFVESRFLRTNKTASDWIEVKRKIQEKEIQDHFKGICYVGYILRETKTNFFVFDLDCHTPEKLRTLKPRKEKIESVFGAPHFIFRTPNNGLHLYYRTSEQFLQVEIRYYVEALVRLRSGDVELFPNGNGLRLFGGKDCVILDNNLSPVNIGFGQYFADYFWEMWQSGERIDLKSISQTKTHVNCKYTKKFISECEYILENGLTEPSTRNESLLKLNRYFQGYRHFDQGETTKKLKAWIDQKHNGFSKDYNRSPQTVHKQIDALVKLFDPSKASSALRIINPIPPYSHTSDEKGRIRYIAVRMTKNINGNLKKAEEFLEDLFAYIKNNQEGGLVEIPKRIFQKCRNGSETRYKKYKDALATFGILTVAKNYSVDLGRCYKYKVSDDLR